MVKLIKGRTQGATSSKPEWLDWSRISSSRNSSMSSSLINPFRFRHWQKAHNGGYPQVSFLEMSRWSPQSFKAAVELVKVWKSLLGGWFLSFFFLCCSLLLFLTTLRLFSSTDIFSFCELCLFIGGMTNTRIIIYMECHFLSYRPNLRSSKGLWTPTYPNLQLHLQETMVHSFRSHSFIVEKIYGSYSKCETYFSVYGIR